MAVTGEDGVDIRRRRAGDAAATIPVDFMRPVQALITGIEERLDSCTSPPENADGQPILRPASTSPATRRRTVRYLRTDTIRMPGAVDRIVYDPATELVHVLGTRPMAAPHGLRRRAARERRVRRPQLPFDPSAWALDTSRRLPERTTAARPGLRRARARRPRSTSAHYPFAWRLPGRDRGRADRRRCSTCSAGSSSGGGSWRVLVAASSRWSTAWSSSRAGSHERRLRRLLHPRRVPAVRARSGSGLAAPLARSGSACPSIGVLLGLALASKWVAAYAIGALGILLLLGRRARPGASSSSG